MASSALKSATPSLDMEQAGILFKNILRKWLEMEILDFPISFKV